MEVVVLVDHLLHQKEVLVVEELSPLEMDKLQLVLVAVELDMHKVVAVDRVL